MTAKNKYEFTVSQQELGVRLDAYLSSRADLAAMTRSYIQKLIGQGAVTVNGAVATKSYRVNSGDDVCAVLALPKELAATAQDIALDIIYEDDWIVVLNKPKGMVVHPAPGNRDGTLVNALLYHCGDSLSGINGVLRPGIVHRIDKDTSGLLVVAKSDAAHKALAVQIEDHSMNRIYYAVVHGSFSHQKDRIDLPIGRNERDRKKFCVTQRNARNAVTNYEVLAQYDHFSYLRLKLETGRTHQIRVHMAHIGHPVAGDTVYGPKNTPKQLMGQCLHAGLLGFCHPESGAYIEFEASLPEYFTSFLKGLQGNANGKEDHGSAGSV